MEHHVIGIGDAIYEIGRIRSIQDGGFYILVIFDEAHIPPYQLFTGRIAEVVRAQAYTLPPPLNDVLPLGVQSTFRNVVELVGQISGKVDQRWNDLDEEVTTALISTENQSAPKPEEVEQWPQYEWHYIRVKGAHGEWLAALPLRTMIFIRGHLSGQAQWHGQRKPHLLTTIIPETITVLESPTRELCGTTRRISHISGAPNPAL